MLKFVIAAKNKFDAITSRFFTKKEEGASLVEYGLLVGLIAVVCIAAITLLGNDIRDLFNRLAGKLSNVGT